MLLTIQVWFWKMRFMRAARNLAEMNALPIVYETSMGARYRGDQNVRELHDALSAKALWRMERAAARLVLLANARADAKRGRVAA